MVTIENFRNAVDSYVNKVLVDIKMPDWKRIAMKGAASYFIEKNADMLKFLSDEEGMIDNDALERAFMPHIEKMGSFSVLGFTFRQEDFQEFFAKAREYNNGQ